MMMMYMLLAIMSLNISFWWWIWLMLELMNWFLMTFIKNFSFMMCFMIWQSLASLGLILNFMFINNTFMIVMFFFFKMGLPPFHFWFWSFSNFWMWKSLILFLFIHKYTPTLILLNFMMNMLWKWLLILPFFSFMMFFVMFSLKNFLFSMSMSESSWMLFSGMVSMKVMLIYFIMNIIMMFVLLNLFYENMFNYKINNFNFMIFLMIYLGLPPFVTFMLKFMILLMIKILFSIILLFNTLLNIFLLWAWIYMNMMNLKYSKFKHSLMFYMLFLMNMLWVMIN